MPKGYNLTIDLINGYKNRPYLWNKCDPKYKNITARQKGIEELLEIYSLYDPNATVDHVKCKLNSLRKCYRKEKKKVDASSNSDTGEFHVPSLWYYDHISFLDSCSIPSATDNTGNESEDNVHEKEGPHESGTVTTKNFDASLEVVKSADKPTVVKLTAVTPQLDTTPQNQLDILNDNVQNSPPRMQTSVRLKRLVSPSSVQGPLRIVRKVPPQLGQTVTTTTNQSSVKSFVNLLEQELNALSEDYATMAQVEIYRIVGEFKLKDVSRRQARIQVQKLHVDKPQPVRILTVQKIQAQPDIPIEITPDLPIEIKTEPTS
ncbi:uncharacterized protein LOC131272544 isoform X1 [Anopheles coustani]|uniref:uncharacterized protein LOC131272544 isoform X1 n=1 Tax=Anopheles coustani TaxID=139045 RepID=UPI00265AB273|nr:uncharacterized protein LOC131272544 isoform X1 [Anopheles coustani]